TSSRSERNNLAQHLSAGYGVKTSLSAVGTAQFSRTAFSHSVVASLRAAVLTVNGNPWRTLAGVALALLIAPAAAQSNRNQQSARPSAQQPTSPAQPIVLRG